MATTDAADSGGERGRLSNNSISSEVFRSRPLPIYSTNGSQASSPTYKSWHDFVWSQRWWLFSPLVIFILIVFFGSYYVYSYQFLWTYLLHLKHERALAISLGAVFHLLYILTVLSYVRTIFTNPGEVPELFDSIKFRTNEFKSDGADRFCQKCQRKKPDRTHHCRMCQRCVLKMDHHCPWVNNCIGFANQKFFVLFLSYVVILGAFVGGTTAPFVLKLFDKNTTPKHSEFLTGSVLGVCVVSSVFAIGILGLAIYHWSLVLRNLTTLENTEKMIRLGAGRGNPFDLGSPYENWTEVFGDNPLLWFLPIKTSRGDGLSFTITLPSDNTTTSPSPSALSESKPLLV